jgi:hypothetical protein
MEDWQHRQGGMFGEKLGTADNDKNKTDSI